MNKKLPVRKKNLKDFTMKFTRLKKLLMMPWKLTEKVSKHLKNTFNKQKPTQVSQGLKSTKSRITSLKREKKLGIMFKLRELLIISLPKNREQLLMVPVPEFALVALY